MILLLQTICCSSQKVLISWRKFVNKKQHHRIWDIAPENYSILPILSVTAITFWVIYPSLPYPFNTERKMFSKRPDKHTTGLINMRNDCFANSSIQAYSSLPGLTKYLNQMMDVYLESLQLIRKFDIDLSAVVSIESLPKVPQSKFSQRDSLAEEKTVSQFFRITLHIALAKIIRKLQDTQLTSRTISVWTFLHEIERIYNAKISRSQHDAHELTQLINETLENENVLCNHILRELKAYLIEKHLSCELENLEFPEFPFNGLVLSQMKCLSCGFLSKPNITSFLMLTLHPPQELSTDLTTLLDENESETITEYNCVKCRLQKVVATEALYKEQGKSNSAADQKLVDEVIELNNSENLFINDDLRPELEMFLKSYNKLGLNILDITSTVSRQTHILKPPKVFGIHLSRSAFNGVTVSRNPCRVSFSDKLSLSIEEAYVKDLQKLQSADVGDSSATVHESRVLTTDINDMEDASVQQEDVDVKGEEWVVSHDISDTESRTLSTSNASSISSLESILESTQPASKHLRPSSQQGQGADDTLNLIKHFKDFKFNDNNIYRYRLKAIIRHQGSHTQGHYECYKSKPLFVKDGEGTILKLSPEISQEKIEAIDSVVLGSKAEDVRKKSTSTTDLHEHSDNEKGNLREKFSLMIGRRPSIIQADPNDANLQEIINSGLATPAEVMVNEANYFHPPSAREIQQLFDKFSVKNDQHQSTQVKMKKIPSIIKFPYWRVGDAQVAEVSKSAVLFETASVYMLYFERVDRKQIKS